MSTETAIKPKLTPGTRVRVTTPRQIKQELKGQIFEVVEMTTDEAFKVYRNDAATDWELICKGEKYARPTWILERSEVEVYSAGFPSPSLKYREGDRLLEDLNTENVQLDSLIRHGTFMDYRRMDGAGKNLYPFVRWDDGSEGYSNEETLERSDKPAPSDPAPSTQHLVPSTATAVEAEIVPADPADRLAQVEADIDEGIALVKKGRQKLWSAISAIQQEPELLTANGYSSTVEYLKERWGWQRSYAYENLNAAEIFTGLLNSGIPESEIPQSTSALTELGKVEPEQRADVLREASEANGGKATAKAIKQAAPPKVDEFDELTDGEAEELQIYRPDTSPDTIREGLAAGYITATITLADGDHCEIGDHIAYSTDPTALAGRVTGFTPQGRIEYTRMGKTLYVDPQVVVHQKSIAIPHAEPQQAASSAPDEQTITETPAPAESDPKSASAHPSKMAVHYSSETPEHYTPREVIDAAIACLGAIDLDPCSNSHHTPNVPSANHFTRDDDGLSQLWQGRVYMNPPYGREIGSWVEKLCAEHEAGNVDAAIALVPARTDTQWFKRLQDYAWCAVEGRLTFVGSDGGAPFPSAIFYLGDDIGGFYRCFAEMGAIYQRLCPEILGE